MRGLAALVVLATLGCSAPAASTSRQLPQTGNFYNLQLSSQSVDYAFLAENGTLRATARLRPLLRFEGGGVDVYWNQTNTVTELQGGAVFSIGLIDLCGGPRTSQLVFDTGPVGEYFHSDFVSFVIPARATRLAGMIVDWQLWRCFGQRRWSGSCKPCTEGNVIDSKSLYWDIPHRL